MKNKDLNLFKLGYNTEIERQHSNNDGNGFIIGRIAAEHRERYLVKTEKGDREGEILGNLRYSASSRSDFPVLGDWVSCTEYDDDKVLIHTILPRKSLIERQAAGKQGEKQSIASNVDYAFIVVSVDRDFSINRIERYLTICHDARVEPIVLLTKTDLIDSTKKDLMINSLKDRIPRINVYSLSNISGEGIDIIRKQIKPGLTYCLMGSSGVGKSTLLNKLAGKDIMNTGDIGEASGRGRHITSHRELRVLEDGGIIIDNPGMRELGIADSGDGLDITFDSILNHAQHCRYGDCTHTTEDGCAVIEAVDQEEIDRGLYDNFLRLEREKDHYESSLAERRQKDKDFGKMIKNVKKDIKKLGKR